MSIIFNHFGKNFFIFFTKATLLLNRIDLRLAFVGCFRNYSISGNSVVCSFTPLDTRTF